MESSSRSKRWSVFAAVVAALALGFAGPARTAPLPADVLPLAAVKAGMKGYGLTVLHGSNVERFDVEVLGVIPNTLGRSQILVRVSGLGLEKTGILAGMSGSPVYFEGRLAGAVAATWGFSKEPIAAVTPIESMLAIDTDDAASGNPGRARSASSGAGFSAFEATLALPEEERVLALQKIVDARDRPCRRARRPRCSRPWPRDSRPTRSGDGAENSRASAFPSRSPRGSFRRFPGRLCRRPSGPARRLRSRRAPR